VVAACAAISGGLLSRIALFRASPAKHKFAKWLAKT